MSDITPTPDSEQLPPILTEIPLKIEGTEVVTKLKLEQTIPDCFGGTADVLFYSVCDAQNKPITTRHSPHTDRYTRSRPDWHYTQGVVMARTKQGILIKMSENDIKAFGGLFNGKTRIVGKPEVYDLSKSEGELPAEASAYLDDLKANPDKNVTPITITFTD